MTPNATRIVADVTRALANALAGAEPAEDLLHGLLALWPCDAAALLRLEPAGLVPVAVRGLSEEVLGRPFPPDRHPRLRSILAQPSPVIFDQDDPREDPWDGFVTDSPSLTGRVHACMGARLEADGQVLGALTMDALQPDSFEHVEPQLFEVFASLAAIVLQTSALLQTLDEAATRGATISRQLVADALSRHGGNLLGQTAAIARLRDELSIVAPTDLGVLITGETGTGKELVARMLHARSRRADRPLVYLNCAALPESIAESELFGHLKGAFTGATHHRAGKLELADGGTLFLDEIGELPASIQPKLLRAIQFGEIQRVGSDRLQHVDVRIIAATNRNLEDEVRGERFRADLLHRLSVYPLHVPPLRDRADDIPLLAAHFLDRARTRLGCPPMRLHPLSTEALVAWGWPGNVRELEHVLTRAALRTTAAHPDHDPNTPLVVSPEWIDLPQPPGRSHHVDAGYADRSPQQPPRTSILPSRTRTRVPDPFDGLPMDEAIRKFRRTLIERALDRSNGNWAAAARLLHVDRGNLYRMGQRLGLK